MPTTREQVAALFQVTPPLTLAEIAARIGVSRQRVCQIAAQLGTREPVRRIRPARHFTPAELEANRRLAGTLQGRVTELQVAADLVARGWRVYWPLTGGGPDLLAIRNQQLVRVEVRSGKRQNGMLIWARPEAVAELYAIVCGADDITYAESKD